MIDDKLMRDISNYILRKTGKLYFKDIKKAGNNLLVTCPYHKNANERKPSCGIRINPGNSVPIGTMSCFSCEKTTSLDKCLKDILGNLYDESEIESLFHLKVELAKSYFQPIQKEAIFDIPNINLVNKVSYNKYSKLNKEALEYLHNRNINDDIIKKYDLGYDNVNKHILFPIMDKNKNILALGRRSINNKIYRYPPNFIKPIYGIAQLEYPIRYLWICEGPFNVWTLSQYNKQAVGLLGTGTDTQRKQLLNIKCDGYVLALDPDEAGRKGKEKIINYLLENHRYNINICIFPIGKDVNNLNKEEFSKLQVINYKTYLNNKNIY